MIEFLGRIINVHHGNAQRARIFLVHLRSGGLVHQIFNNRLCGVDRDRVAHALHAVDCRFCGVDTDQTSFHIQERAAAVSEVDRRIGLYHIVCNGSAAGGNTYLAVKRADDACRDGLSISKRIADGNRPLADLHFVGITELDNADLIGHLVVDVLQFNGNHRQIHRGVGALYQRRSQCLLTVLIILDVYAEADRQLLGILHHVIVCSDQKLIVILSDDDAGAAAGSLLLIASAEEVDLLDALVCDRHDRRHRRLRHPLHVRQSVGAIRAVLRRNLLDLCRLCRRRIQRCLCF